MGCRLLCKSPALVQSGLTGGFSGVRQVLAFSPARVPGRSRHAFSMYASYTRNHSRESYLRVALGNHAFFVRLSVRRSDMRRATVTKGRVSESWRAGGNTPDLDGYDDALHRSPLIRREVCVQGVVVCYDRTPCTRLPRRSLHWRVSHSCMRIRGGGAAPRPPRHNNIGCNDLLGWTSLLRYVSTVLLRMTHCRRREIH